MNQDTATEFSARHPVAVLRRGKVIWRFASVRCAAATVAYWGAKFSLRDDITGETLDYTACLMESAKGLMPGVRLAMKGTQ